jgi:hypothetical protein
VNETQIHVNPLGAWQVNVAKYRPGEMAHFDTPPRFRGGGVWKNTFAEHPDGLDHFMTFGEYIIGHMLTSF